MLTEQESGASKDSVFGAGIELSRDSTSPFDKAFLWLKKEFRTFRNSPLGYDKVELVCYLSSKHCYWISAGQIS